MLFDMSIYGGDSEFCMARQPFDLFFWADRVGWADVART